MHDIVAFFTRKTGLLKLLLIALRLVAALPGHAAPRVPHDDGEVLERLPLRLRDARAEQLRSAAIALVAAAWMLERVFDLKIL